MVYKYAYQGYNEEKMARAVGLSLKGLSRKDGIEIAKFIRGKEISFVLSYLEDVKKLEKSIPYTRFNSGLGHQKGKMGPGRFPVKACAHFIKIIKSVRHNAQDKNLNVDNLIIKNICVQNGPKQFHYGRHSGRLVKQSHMEIVVCEKEEKNDDSKLKKSKKSKKEVAKKAE
jgi:ribosomal protein uL22